MQSALYTGTVIHQRWKPVRHKLAYRALYVLIDLDELPALDRGLRLFSLRFFSLFSFRERDHGDGSDRPLRAQIEAHLHAAGIDADGGPIRLLAMPRILGTVFNPISVFFCYRKTGELSAIFYEVNNTFGQRHSYLIPVAGKFGADTPLRHTCDKRFFVSPFMEMAMTYHFRLTVPDARLALVVSAHDAAGATLTASFVGRRAPLTDTNLLRVFFRFPLLAMQVLGAIHWEALKLWRKGMKLQARPLSPTDAVTVAVRAVQK